jgi:hypothetical protein
MLWMAEMAPRICPCSLPAESVDLIDEIAG